ncbi:MAG: DUF6435 family protein [Planctomycetaceae bacterium]
MLGWLKKDPVKELEKKYAKKLEEAVELQRKGDIVGFSDATAESEKILQQIDELKAKS